VEELVSLNYNIALTGGVQEVSLFTLPELAADALGSYLAEQLNRRFGSTNPRLTEFIPHISKLALDCIGNSDALYHNVEHTMLVTQVGNEIMAGRARLMPTSANDYAHVIAACLFHDIGYVRGILKEDGADGYVIDSKGHKAALARGSSDAALMPYHVDRSKLFVKDRIAESKLLDADRISSAIECTRFPPLHGPNDENREGFLVRAADLIGQLGDPHYLRKANALYHEFEEVGMNRQLGYASPADLTDQYPQFYWSSVSAHIQPAIQYLNVTSSGRRWIANLYSNVFRAELATMRLTRSPRSA
jgi:hypothetical protein